MTWEFLTALAFGFALGAIGIGLAWARSRKELASQAAIMNQAAHHHEAMARELAASTARLAEAMDGSRLAMWELDMRTGEVNLSSNWWALMGGVPRESPLPIADLIDRVPDGEQVDCWAAVRAVLRGSSSFYDVEHRVRRDDGSLVWIRSRGAVSERSGDGRVLRMTGTNFDITARKKAQIALARSESALRLIGDGLGLRILLVDAELRVLFASVPSDQLEDELQVFLRSRLDQLRAGIAAAGEQGPGGNDVLCLPRVEAGELVCVTVVIQPRSSALTQSRNAFTFGESNDSFGATNQ